MEIIILEFHEYKNNCENDHSKNSILDNWGIMVIFNKATSNYTMRVMELEVRWFVGQPAITAYFMNIHDSVAIQLY
jgi:hypothetical protein